MIKLKSIFGSANDRYIKKLKKTTDEINALEAKFEALTDVQMREKTAEFKKRVADGESLDALLPEAFALVREASKRVLEMRPFDVQLIGGIILHKGKIAEMKTGEGKTLVATLPVYLNALAGKGVHVVTVNDYLAKRDSGWMGKIYEFLGLTVGCITSGIPDKEERKKAYACDITYATNNELGFDYLRDNTCFSKEEMVQRPFYFAIVDEVDSILIDEARTPLILSGMAEDSSEKYMAVDRIMTGIKPEHYDKDEKHRSVSLNEAGTEYVEQQLQAGGMITGGLYDIENITYVHHVEQALRAHVVFKKDVDYIVKDDQVLIIDEFTGRIMQCRRYGNGQHQAIEAKEHVKIQAENQTLASITFQNYFRMYPKLAGMTGTAMTEAGEFDSIYHLEVIEIPTNKPSGRKDAQDQVYRTAEEKYTAVVEEIQAAHNRKQPILVGTTSIEKSELLAHLLKTKTDIPFNVLNARHHEQEAVIIAQAGVPGAVTIATNMAGRGTDIQLGGNLEMRLKEEKEKNPDALEETLREQIKKEIAENKKIALDAGGLYVLGSERHESRRIDNQLRGRSGRQGDPGLSKFYVSLEDNLMRIFGSERIGNILKTLGMPKGQAIDHPWISKAIAKAQQKVEAYHFDLRKDILKYDDVMNEQRQIIYAQRREMMEATDITDIIKSMRDDCIENTIYTLAPEKSTPEDWDEKALTQEILNLVGLEIPFSSWLHEPGITPDDMRDRIIKLADQMIDDKMKTFPVDLREKIEKNVLIQTIDQSWKEHLQMLDFLKTSIGLRAYAQKNPLNEYKQEAFYLFESMLGRVRERATHVLCLNEFQIRPEPAPMLRGEHQSVLEPQNKEDEENFASAPAKSEKTGRNSPCPCGSGKKYKHCCGKLN